MVALKAEYGVGAGVLWHIVPDGDNGWALCHRLLSPIAEMRSLTGNADGLQAEPLCERCRVAFDSGTRLADDGPADASAPE